MRLEPYLKPGNVLVLQGIPSRDDLLERLACLAHAEYPSIPADRLARELIDREKRYPTSILEGAAFPHAILDEIDHRLVIVALCRPPVSFGVRGHPPSELVFGMFGHANEPWEHVRMLARVARICHGPSALARLKSAKDAAELFDLLIAEDRKYG